MIMCCICVISCTEEESEAEREVGKSASVTKEPEGYEGGVERMTLGELNRYLVKNGLEPIKQSDIDDVLERRRIYKESQAQKGLKSSCYQPFGDWSRQLNRSICNYNPWYISVQDIVLAQNYINAYTNNGGSSASSGNAWNGYPACTSENFGTISYWELGTKPYTVDQDDKNIVAAAILGNCN